MTLLADEPNAKTSAPEKNSGVKGNSLRGGFLVERPGGETGSWEQWLVGEDRSPILLKEPLSGSAQQNKKLKRILCLPSQSLHDWPLWIAGEGDRLALARLELSGRHLIKRGMEQSLSLFPINSEKDRQLVLAICPEEPFPEESLPSDWREAGSFDLPVRTLGDEKTDLIVWSEWDRLHAAFLIDGKPVWFCPVDEERLGGLLQRTALRLQVEGILKRVPSTILLAGISSTSLKSIRSGLTAAFPTARLTLSENLPPPHLPTESLDLPPAAAREERANSAKKNRLLTYAMIGAIIYTLLLIWGSGDLLIHRMELARIRKAIVAVAAPASEARADSERWKAMRSAIDPSFYALDLLAAVAAPTEGGKVRLTRFTLEPGKLQVSGEATDVTQAYAFQEQLKKSPALQAYEWTAGQPQLAGKNSVRFDMEGSRSDANTGTK
ncbi:MAG: hypothetical protein EBR40_08710 [Proteobacteria bacterium]|nr:hypothetical protein [Pseudomonadota bacterium]